MKEACRQINSELFRCVLARIEDIEERPAETFGIEELVSYDLAIVTAQKIFFKFHKKGSPDLFEETSVYFEPDKSRKSFRQAKKRI